MRDSTLVLTSHGKKAIADLTCRDEVVSWSEIDQKYLLSPASGAYPKGKANLVRVITTRGEFVASEQHLVYALPHKYLPVCQLRPGDELRQADLVRLQTSSGLSRIWSPSNDKHYWQRLLDYPGDYGLLSHRYDRQLLMAIDSALVFALQQDDAQAFFQFSCQEGLWQTDDLAQKQKHSHQDQFVYHLSKMYCDYLLETLEEVLVSQTPTLSVERTFAGSLKLLKSLANLFSRRTLILFDQLEREIRAIFSACSINPFLGEAIPFREPVLEYSIYSSQADSPFRGKTYSHRKLSVDFDAIHSFNNSATKATIISLEKLKKPEWFYDLHVAGTNNYITADGAIHHNSGKSQGGTYRVAKLMLEDPGINCGYYFPTYDLINLRGIPGLCRDLETLGITKYTVNRSEYFIDIENYGKVIFRSYDRPERIVAYEVAHSIVDELDTLPRDKAETVWRKVVERNRQRCNHPAGNTVGCVTTPDQGQLGFVFEKWGSVELQDGYELIKASTYSNPFNPPDYADNILKNYDEDLARCYLEGEFVSLAHRTVFNRKDMEAALKECFKPIKRMVLEKSKFVERDNGELRVWAEPKPGAKYVIGADVAEGLADGDYSCADVIELSTGYQVAQWHGRIAPDLFARVLMALGYWYNKADVGCENNNHGLLVNVLMRDEGYPNIYIQTTIDDRGSAEKETRRLGFTTTTRTKPYIMDNLSALLREKQHGIACAETVKEMMTYVIDEKGAYNAIIGCYDDRVMSYAIAQYLVTQSAGYKRKAA